MESSTLVTILGIFLVAFLMGVILISVSQNKKRRQAFESFALERGFTYTADDPSIEASLQNLGGFDLFQHGHSRKFKNLLHSRRSNLDIHIFDYRYTTGSGKNSQTHNQTALLLTLPGDALPQFFLRPEGLIDKLAVKMGQADINFDHHPEFSKKFRLTGADENQVRRLFNEALLTFLLQSPGLCLEAGGTQVLCYARGKLIKPEDLPTRLDQALKVVSLLS
jgi:hypothetical protein